VALVLVLVNDGSGDATTGHYRVEARLNRRVLASARVEGFRRTAGWHALLRAAVDAVTPDATTRRSAPGPEGTRQ
jgi:hypothetical protein